MNVIYDGIKVEEDEMGETCGMHGAVNAFKILV
jgi:hypothetical protein